MSYEKKSLSLTTIRIDGGTQSRVSLNQTVVDEYAHAITEGASMPPVAVYFDGTDYWLADGFHRYFATKKIGALTIDAELVNGTKREAQLFSVGANDEHGMRRSNEDKRKSVTTLLNDPEWSQWSGRDIARRCRVGNHLVEAVRSSLSENSVTVQRVKQHDPAQGVTYKTKHGTTAKMNTSGQKDAGQKRAEKNQAEKKAQTTEPAKTTVATQPEKHDEKPGPVEVTKPLSAAAQAKAAKQESKALEENVALKARVAELEEELTGYRDHSENLTDELKALRLTVDPNHARKFLEQSGYVRVLESQRDDLMNKNVQLVREVKSLRRKLGHA